MCFKIKIKIDSNGFNIQASKTLPQMHLLLTLYMGRCSVCCSLLLLVLTKITKSKICKYYKRHSVLSVPYPNPQELMYSVK